MNFLSVCKNILVSFLVTTSIYFGFVPFVLLKPSPIETQIEIAPNPPPLQLSMEAVLHSEDHTELTEKSAPPKKQKRESIERHLELPMERLKTASVEVSKTATIPSTKREQVLTKREQALTVRRSTPKKKNNKKRNCTVDNPNIQKINARSYTLPRKLIRHYSRNWTEASRLAYLGWSKDANGTVRGVKIRHISCNSPLPFAGLKRGDVVTAVNGKSINSNAQLLKLYPRLFHWRTIELSVLRNGRPLKIQYQVIA